MNAHHRAHAARERFRELLALHRDKNHLPPQSIPLRLARMCLDCETIYEAPRHSCPACGSQAWDDVAGWLNR